ncbi:hypothetical protein RKE29_01495 [Streptomyces sp. B1866]|uniref:hypothetical protein n=1 Tax=Streptomyces sp. B1866 TaxID=3075431 RepID=UPI00289252F8|nr:hypothetical protein [Streptomyces sp. B1866]MDT3395334.1 hypothetical protein [Streptomyces sp. B1866]
MHAASRTAEVAEVLTELLDERFGALGELERLVETTAAWCERLDTDEGRALASRLRTVADHVAFLGDRIADAEADLQNMPAVLPATAPPLAPARGRAQSAHGARARAAVAASPHRPPPSATASSPRRPAVPPGSGPARAR